MSLILGLDLNACQHTQPIPHTCTTHVHCAPCLYSMLLTFPPTHTYAHTCTHAHTGNRASLPLQRQPLLHLRHRTHAVAHNHRTPPLATHHERSDQTRPPAPTYPPASARHAANPIYPWCRECANLHSQTVSQERARSPLLPPPILLPHAIQSKKQQ
jgi:hypothetical protein